MLRLFRRKAREKALRQPATGGGWRSMIHEAAPGNWQRNVEIDQTAVLAFHAVFACMTLIARDIAKLRVKLVVRDTSGIWSETSNAAYSPVLRKPNSYQTRIQFWESWILSKLSHGNAYILKVRDNRGVVIQMHVLDPHRVRPLISDDGQVFYEIQPDNLAAGTQQVVVPAREIIHDRFNTLFHPLVGLSPIYASGLAATQGLNIQNNSAAFFGNASTPGGILSAPGAITDETAQRLKSHWETNYSGRSAGKIAVLGDNLKFERLAVTAKDAEMVDQLKWTAEVVCSTFHVPPYKIGVGALPSYNNVQALNVEYYTQCLQSLIEEAELCLDEGLAMSDGIGTEFDLDGLLRMDSVTQMDVLERSKNVLTLDERRARLDRKPITGGATVYMQEQDHSIEAIAARDKLLIAQSEAPAPVAPPAPEPEPDDTDEALWMLEAKMMRAADARH
ncbi:phage portal protein [Falsirhodobacter sp. 20TX0035]|uniref:phage portal protein n=1 Tax=Falsirhodobacter sp. 20TX0035 TaxID=3022019 RepID=UPI0023302113|nr:phage portal protein [Falsirhodobacter sp. 20TX0035]MDB6455010.1 phage portal protein [Falsirhodobacter sp. 20TX0035]